MSGADPHHTKARAVPIKEATRIELATLSVRPQRLAFVVDVHARQEELLAYIQYNTAVWGGWYNYLIPMADSVIAAKWWKALESHDPDIVVLCGTTDDKLKTAVTDRIQPFFLADWASGVLTNLYDGLDIYSSVYQGFILEDIYRRLRPTQPTNIRVPIVGTGSPYSFAAAAQIGAYDDDLHDYCTRALKAGTIDFQCSSLADYLKAIDEAQGQPSPLTLTREGLSTTHAGDGTLFGFTVFVLGEDRLAEDLALLWDMRACGGFGAKGILVLPAMALEDDDSIRILGEWCSSHVSGTNLVMLVSMSLGPDKLGVIRDSLKLLLPADLHISLCYGPITFDAYRAHEPDIIEEVRLQGRTINIRTGKPCWFERTRGRMSWVIDVDLQGIALTGRGYVPPKFSQLNTLLSTTQNWHREVVHRQSSIRFAHEQISIHVGNASKPLQITLPDDEQMFKVFLAAKGYDARMTDKCRYARGLMALLGSMEELRILSDQRVRDLLCALEKKDQMPFAEMTQHYKARKDAKQGEDLRSLVYSLAERGVLIRGIELHCPICDLRHWYDLSEVKEMMACAGCLRTIQPALDAPFSYRLNHLVSRAIAQGSLTLLLTLRAMVRLGMKGYIFQPGIAVTKGNRTIDLDIIAICDGVTIVAESKGESECTADRAPVVIQQLEEVAQVAEDIGARIVILGTLATQLPPELEHGIVDIRMKHPALTVRVAKRIDLELGYLVADGPDSQLHLEDLLPHCTHDRENVITEGGTVFVSG